MKWEIRPDRPVYVQLVERLEAAILTGEYPPGQRVPGVRELAAQAAVNPNTMQRALAELEARGLLETHRTAGRTVTSDAEKLAALRAGRARAQARAFLTQMRALGLSGEEAAALLDSEAAAEKEES